MSVAALAGWIVLGICCAGALGLIAAGAIAVVGAQRTLKRSLARIEDKQRAVFDAPRFEAAAARLSRDAAEAKLLLERARTAIATMTRAIRFAIAAFRLVRSLR